MNSLKFIEEEIHFNLVVKKEYEKMLNDERPDNQKGYLKTLITEYEEKLQKLHQIKTELEAWEAIKSELVIDKHVANSYEDEYRTITFKNGCIDDIEILENKSKINAISKALEVKETWQKEECSQKQ